MTNQLTHADPDATTASTTPNAADRSPSRTIRASERTAGRLDRPRHGRRWLVLAGGAALIAAVAVSVATRGGTPIEPGSPAVEERPAELIVGTPAYLTIRNEIDRALAERSGVPDAGEPDRPTAQIVQDQIDAALAEREAEAAPSDDRPAYVIIQDEIDRALAELAAASDGAVDN